MTIEVPGFTVPDVGDSLTKLIEQEWDPANTGNEVPNIEFVNDVKRVRFMGEDTVIVTSLQEHDYPASLQYQWENVNYTFNVQAYTGVSRERSQMMKEEIRRIFHANRIDPLEDIDELRGTAWLWIRRFTDNVHRWRMAWRWTMDGELKVRYRKIRT